MTDVEPVLLMLDAAVWTPGAEWERAVQHIASRFARSHPLDATAVLAEPTIGGQVAALEAWSAESNVDLDRELARFFDEHLPMHLRPVARTTRAVRALASNQPVIALSALPPRAAESVARHTGVWRSLTRLLASVRSDGDVRRACTELGASRVVRNLP